MASWVHLKVKLFAGIPRKCSGKDARIVEGNVTLKMEIGDLLDASHYNQRGLKLNTVVGQWGRIAAIL